MFKTCYKHGGILPMLLALMAFTAIILFSSSCSSSTSSENGSLSGKVVLVNNLSVRDGDPVDFEGITVALYQLAVVDTEVARINREHPELGVIADQMTDFDHRKQQVYLQTTTDAEGNFSLSGIRPGNYNLIVFKDEYGLVCKYNIALGAQANSLSSIIGEEQLTLYKEKHFAGIYQQGTYVFSALNNTVIDSDTQFTQGTTVVIEPGALIRIGSGKKISFSGSVKMKGTAEKPFLVFSNDRFLSTELVSSISSYDRISVETGASLVDGTVDYGYFFNCSTGLFFTRSFKVSNCIFRSSNSGVIGLSYWGNPSNAEVTQCTFYPVPMSESYDVSISSYISLSFTKNIMPSTAAGLDITATQTVTVNNNYFNNRLYGIYIHSETEATITHNLIKCADIGIFAYNSCTLHVTYNDIEADTGIKFGYVRVNADITYNNLLCTDKTISAVTWGGDDIIATNNYWGTTDPTLIEQGIVDKRDYSPTTHINYDILTTVIYQPFRNSLISSAGIQ